MESVDGSGVEIVTDVSVSCKGVVPPFPAVALGILLRCTRTLNVFLAAVAVGAQYGAVSRRLVQGAPETRCFFDGVVVEKQLPVAQWVDKFHHDLPTHGWG